MIKKTSQGYQVKSENGQHSLSRPNLTKQEAEQRLRQIEYFKNRDDGRRSLPKPKGSR